ncbi:acyl carrier protein [Nocardioides sp. W3-2-3]|uniref:hypothetical protein n=1 Tax=Nocardioides convexus TaxID=2712224 RepID=UPI0024185E1A|nr:hypothetical protein [Nocardioides convexus]NHA01535.1 acyl carrier protein [Nocardioides convexus]
MPGQSSWSSSSAPTRSTASLTDDLSLYGGGLDSTPWRPPSLSAVLEDEFGSDPFSTSDVLPETVGEVLAFYNAA